MLRCPKCAKTYSIGRKGNFILLLGVMAAAGIGFAIFDKSLLLIGGVACVFGALIEFLIWALDEPVAK